MRRLTSILTSLAVAAGAVSISSSAALAAGGTLTKKTSATVAPAAVPNATTIRMIRLSKSNSFLALGYNSQAAGARMFLWKINEDLSIDSSFGAVDLGANTALPTASNSSCVANNNNNMANCWYLSGFEVNEIADRYVMTMNRQLNGTGNSSNLTASINTMIVGKISTGAVTASTIDMTSPSAFYPVADWSTYGATDLSKQLCTSKFGATYQTVPLQYARLETYSTLLRPDGSFAAMISCDYSNMEGSNSSTHVKEYDTRALVGLKASGSTLVVDTSWGTNGYLTLFDDPTKCNNMWFPPSKPNTAITSLSSSDVFATVQTTKDPRTSTYPYGGGVPPASYDGCGSGGYNPNLQLDMTLLSLNIKGAVMATNTLAGLGGSYLTRWVIDPKGNWNSILNTMGGSTPTRKLIRLNTKGQLDTSLGADGMKTLTGLPSTVTVNGASIPMQYSLAGVAVTATGFYFTGFSTAGFSGSCNNAQNFTNKVYPYYFSPDTGLITSYGTSGLGQELSLEMSITSNCTRSTSLSYINSKGQHGYIAHVPAIGSQAAGLVGATWDAAEGVTSGGEGTGVAGAAGRVDKKVYSTRLPKAAQTDSAVQVLSSRQANDLDIRTNTPKICIALTTSVLMVNSGRCSVRIIDEDTKKVIRTMSTIVKKTEVEEGTTLTTDEPIYFKQANVKLSKTALAQVQELASAAQDAARVVVIGHSAALGDVSQYSYAISRNRAEAVKAALIKAGVKAPIEIVALAYNQPEKTAKTEKAQALNRRAEVFIFPK